MFFSLFSVKGVAIKKPLHNSGQTLVAQSGWTTRRIFAVNNPAIGNKCSAAGRLGLAKRAPQAVRQSLPNASNHLAHRLAELAVLFAPALSTTQRLVANQPLLAGCW